MTMKFFGLSFALASTNALQLSTPLKALYSPNNYNVRTKSFSNTSPAFQNSVVQSFLQKNNYSHQSTTFLTLNSPTKSTYQSSPSTSTSLNGKLWKRLQIEEDDPSDGTSWYLINCVAGVELDLLAQCRMVTSHFPPTDVEKFVVPVQRTLRSHGDKKKVVDVKVRYPGYVFCKIRLTEDVYETLQELELARSWMGTVNRKGHKKLPPAPIPLNYEEVKKFKGLEEETEEFENVYGGDYSGRTDSGEDLLEQYAGYDVGQMVKILKGNFQGEDGTVRRLKDGQLCVRMFTYGQTFDEWFMPDAVRPLTDLEVMRGLSGPTSPVTQDEFDVSIGKKDPRELEKVTNEKSLRSGLMQSAGIAPGRNRREDRVARGETGSRDRWSRTSEEIQQEEANWLAYREEQRASQRGVAPELGLSQAEQEALDRLKMKEEQKKKNRMGDTWGMVERSSWTGGDFGFGDDALDAEEEFKHRTAELYKDRVPRGRRGRENMGFGQNSRAYDRDNRRNSFGDNRRDSYDRERRPVRQSRDRNNDFRGRDRSDRNPRAGDDWSSSSSKHQDDSNDKDDADDFFASLMSELTDDLDEGASKAADPRTQGSRRHDNAGPSAKMKQEKRKGGDEDDFFDNLMSELGGALESSSKNDNDNESNAMEDDDFFSNLEAELSTALGDDFGSDDNDDFSDDDFFSSIQKEIGNSLDTPTKNDEIEIMRDDDFLSTLIDEVTDEIEASESKDTEVEKVALEGTKPSPSENLSSLTVPQLKEMLKSRGLKVGGKKAELIERLQANA